QPRPVIQTQSALIAASATPTALPNSSSNSVSTSGSASQVKRHSLVAISLPSGASKAIHFPDQIQPGSVATSGHLQPSKAAQSHHILSPYQHQHSHPIPHPPHRLISSQVQPQIAQTQAPAIQQQQHQAIASDTKQPSSPSLTSASSLTPGVISSSPHQHHPHHHIHNHPQHHSHQQARHLRHQPAPQISSSCCLPPEMECLPLEEQR
ncbi:unnamed protein product, partial [Protopolystoma xenopodis]